MVESPHATYARHQDLFSLIVRGIDVVAAGHHSRPGAAHDRDRHANVFAGNLRKDLLDWIETRLPKDWEMANIANSGIELHGPRGITISVRRPDSEGHAPEASSERKALIYRQPPLFYFDDDGLHETTVECDGVVATVVATWGYDHVLSEVWLKLSAPSGADTWYWSDVEIDIEAGAVVGVAVAPEEFLDPFSAIEEANMEASGE